jgi:hypothetical protein
VAEQQPDIFADPSRFGLSVPSASPPAPGATPPPPATTFDDPTKFGMKPPPIGTPGAIDPITGRPYQSLRNVPANDPVGQSTGTPIAEGQEPGVTTQAIASLPTDPQQKIRIVAKQLFPDLDQKDAESRIFFGTNGRMAAVGQDGKPFYVDPEPYAPDPMAPTIGGMARSFVPSPGNVASGAGPAIPAFTGAGAGMLAGPTSIFIGPVAAATGAAAGDFFRQRMARIYDPNPDATPYNYGQTATEAAGAGIGQAAGASLMRVFAPNTLFARLADPAQLRASLPQAEKLNALAKSMNVDLTPGQLSGSRGLLGAEDAMASGSVNSAASGAARDFFQGTSTSPGLRNQLMDAFDQRVLDRISSASDKTDASMQFSQGADDAGTIVRRQGNAAAKPDYDAARAGGQVMSPDLAQLMDAPAVKTAMDAARTDYANIHGKVAPDTPDFDLWDLTKRKLDDAYNAAQKDREFTTATAVDSLRKRVLTNLDAAYPTYEAGRATAAPGLRLAARLNAAAGGGGDFGTETAASIMRPVFEGNNPRAISEMRNAFTQAGREDEWNAGTRAYMQDAMDKASKSQDGLNPSSLRMQLWGNPNARAAMQAALGPQQFQGLDNYMSVLEAAARSHGLNSLTVPRMTSAAEIRAAADEGGAGLVRGIGKAANPLAGARDLFGSIADRMNTRTIAAMTDRIFSPEGMKFLQEMSRVSPITTQAIQASSNFLGGQVGASAAPQLSRR